MRGMEKEKEQETETVTAIRVLSPRIGPQLHSPNLEKEERRPARGGTKQKMEIEEE